VLCLCLCAQVRQARIDKKMEGFTDVMVVGVDIPGADRDIAGAEGGAGAGAVGDEDDYRYGMGPMQGHGGGEEQERGVFPGLHLRSLGDGQESSDSGDNPAFHAPFIQQRL
jgi:hypothetical protein